MPWEITIRRVDGAPLGDFVSVRQQIELALPPIRFYRAPSGPERIAAARATGVEFPDVIRKHLEQSPAKDEAEFEGEGISIRLYGFGNQPLDAIHAEVRGSGNPVPALTALCRPNGWFAIDDANRQPVDLIGPAASGWEAFQAYRDKAIRSIQATERSEQS
jgi:hypothetical protein